MRLPIGAMQQVILPIGAWNMDYGSDASGVQGTLTKAGAEVMAAAAQSMPQAAPVMSSGVPSYGTIPFQSNAPSIPTAVAPAAPVTLPAPALPPVVNMTPQQAAAHPHTAALQKATAANVHAGMTPAAAAQKAEADLAAFYGKLQTATPQQKADFLKLSDALGEKQKNEQIAKHKAASDAATAKYIAQGMTPAAARARAESELANLYKVLGTATPQQQADFKKMSEGIAAAEKQREAAAAAAKKLEADTIKNASITLGRDRKSIPITAVRTNSFNRRGYFGR